MNTVARIPLSSHAYLLAVTYLVSVVQGVAPLVETSLVVVAWVLTALITWRLYMGDHPQLAIITFVIWIFYNPFFILSANLDTSPLIEIGCAALFLYVATCIRSRQIAHA